MGRELEQLEGTVESVGATVCIEGSMEWIFKVVVYGASVGIGVAIGMELPTPTLE